MTLKKMVQNVLQNFPESRNSDITLTIKIWKKYYLDKIVFINNKYSVPIQNLYDLPTQDAIKRIRANIQNKEQLYPPTDLDVAKQRKILEQEWYEESLTNFNNI